MWDSEIPRNLAHLVPEVEFPNPRWVNHEGLFLSQSNQNLFNALNQEVHICMRKFKIVKILISTAMLIQQLERAHLKMHL